MDKQLTLDELKEMHGKPVWCRIPSDNPRWGIVDAESSCVVLGANHRLTFYHYGEWKAFTSPDPTPSPTIKPGEEAIHKDIGNVKILWLGVNMATVSKDGLYYDVYLKDLEVIDKQVRDWQEDMEMCEKASPEPWSVDQLEYMGNRGMIQETVIDGVTSEIYNEEDARFISEARQALPYWLQEVKKLCEVNQQEQRKILGLRIRLNAEKERADQAEAREQMLREAIEEAIANINHEAFRTACNGLEDVLASLYTEEGTK